MVGGHQFSVSHREAVKVDGEHESGVVEQQDAVLVLTDACEDDETQLHVMVTLFAFGVLHHNRTEENNQ